MSTNGFTIFVEDRRPDPPAVFEHAAQSTLEAAKDTAVLQAEEYLKERQEQASYPADWRCS